ncbi:MAG: hypothetical protein ACI4VH_06710 [Clostridia bacterium]
MKLENTDQNLLQRLIKNNKTILYVSLVPYKNNTCIKAYDEEGNPLGDIPQKDVPSYINETSVVLFINESIDDDTGLPIYILKTIA